MSTPPLGHLHGGVYGSPHHLTERVVQSKDRDRGSDLKTTLAIADGRANANFGVHVRQMMVNEVISIIVSPSKS